MDEDVDAAAVEKKRPVCCTVALQQGQNRESQPRRWRERANPVFAPASFPRPPLPCAPHPEGPRGERMYHRFPLHKLSEETRHDGELTRESVRALESGANRWRRTPPGLPWALDVARTPQLRKAGERGRRGQKPQGQGAQREQHALQAWGQNTAPLLGPSHALYPCQKPSDPSQSSAASGGAGMERKRLLFERLSFRGDCTSPEGGGRWALGTGRPHGLHTGTAVWACRYQPQGTPLRRAQEACPEKGQIESTLTFNTACVEVTG
jgi:hypothetical protein